MVRAEECPGEQPALVLLYGSGSEKRKDCPLDRDVIVIGRARGADIGLDAPDVSTLHCVLWRGSAGFQVRDCGSRSGTRVNGDAVKEGLLHDGDVLQIGPFSFRVVLPAPSAKGTSREARQRHVEKSRRNLARLALLHRKKVKDMKGLLELSITPTDLNRKASGLRARVRDFERRLQELQQRERELNKDRELLDQERAAHQAKVREAEQTLAQRRAALEANEARLR
jgi:pSer/pThr/pTyr-binding forkhead associated (FHA) protein